VENSPEGEAGFRGLEIVVVRVEIREGIGGVGVVDALPFVASIVIIDELV
jgi:hypothetical protein